MNTQWASDTGLFFVEDLEEWERLCVEAKQIQHKFAAIADTTLSPSILESVLNIYGPAEALRLFVFPGFFTLAIIRKFPYPP